MPSNLRAAWINEGGPITDSIIDLAAIVDPVVDTAISFFITATTTLFLTKAYSNRSPLVIPNKDTKTVPEAGKPLIDAIGASFDAGKLYGVHQHQHQDLQSH